MQGPIPMSQVGTPQQVSVQECRSSSGFMSSWCRAGLHQRICCHPPSETMGTPVLRSLLTMACSVLPRWQSSSNLKSHRLWRTTEPFEVTLVVFCLSVLGSESGFHPLPGGTRGFGGSCAKHPCHKRPGSGMSPWPSPTSWPSLTHSSQGMYSPHTLLTPSSALSLKRFYFRRFFLQFLLFTLVPLPL